MRSSVTEWAGTLLVYLFATATLVQAYVVPTGSMEGNLLIGDHILVDRMVYADPGPLGRHICRTARWNAATSWRFSIPRILARPT